MRWPWRRHQPTGGAEAARKAREELERVQSQWPEVRQISESLRRQRQENRFAERVAELWRGQG